MDETGCHRPGFQQENCQLHCGIWAVWLVGAGSSPRPQLAQKPGSKRFVGLLPSPALTPSPALPPQVPPEKCRCAVGSILSEGEESPSSELIRLYLKFGFKVFSFPAPSHVVTATFPYTTPLSIWLAPRRVHPALDAYIKVRHKSGVCVCVRVRVCSQSFEWELGGLPRLGETVVWGGWHLMEQVPVELERWAEATDISSIHP